MSVKRQGDASERARKTWRDVVANKLKTIAASAMVVSRPVSSVDRRHERNANCFSSRAELQAVFVERSIESPLNGNSSPTGFRSARPIQWIGRCFRESSEPAKSLVKSARLFTSIFLALSFASLASSSASAQSVFDFSYSGPGIWASGVLVTTSEGNGEYLVTSITGEYNGATITGLAAANSFASNDNVIYYPATTQTIAGTGGIAFLDIGGLSFTVGNLSYNVGWVNGSNGYTGSPYPLIPGYGAASGDGSPAETVSINNFTISPAPGPIPGSGALSGLFLGLGLARTLWRRRGMDREASEN